MCYQALNETQLNEAINRDLERLATWFKGKKTVIEYWKKPINAYRKQANITQSKSSNQYLELRVRKNEPDVVQKAKYLGIQVDSSLKWTEQIKATYAKTSREQ